MSEVSSSQPEKGPESQPTIEEVVTRAVEAGYIEIGDLDYSNDDDFDDVLIMLAMYIEQAGDDAETVFKGWGIVEEDS